MNKSYFLSKNGQPSGPFSVFELKAKLESKDLSWTDYVVSEGSSEWEMVLSHPDFAKWAVEMVAPPPSEAPASLPEHLKAKAWYMLKDGDNHGPFSQLEIVKMLQKKEIYDFDYLWQESFSQWKQISEIPEFSSESIVQLLNTPEVEKEEIFFRRRHSRATYDTSLVIHNNKSVFKGKSMEIGAGGAGVLIENMVINPGQTLFLHFKPGSGVPPFNAVCEVVSKRLIEGSLYKYGVKFVNITQATRESIQSYATVKAA